MPTTVITNNDKALDAEVQVTTLTGTNDNKYITPAKLFSWRSWWMSLVATFTNLTDSISTSTGAVTISGGLGVMKSLFTKSLTITDLAGTGARIISVDTNGLTSAPFIVTAPTVTDGPTQNLLTADSSWNDSGVYIGTALTNGIQSQFYKAPTGASYLYFMYDSTTPMRIPTGGVLHLRGMSQSPAATLGVAAGTDANVANINLNGNDVGMNLSFTTGSNPSGSNVATIVFNKAYSTALRSVILQAGNTATAAIQANLYPSSLGTTQFNISITGATLSPNTTYLLYITIIC